jgi:hypothetical protein
MREDRFRDANIAAALGSPASLAPPVMRDDWWVRQEKSGRIASAPNVERELIIQ